MKDWIISYKNDEDMGSSLGVKCKTVTMIDKYTVDADGIVIDVEGPIYCIDNGDKAIFQKDIDDV